MGFFDFIFPGGKNPQLTVAQAAAAHSAGAPVVDIREIIEWNKGHVPSSIHLPKARLFRPTTQLPDGSPLIVMCQDGRTSLDVARKLNKLGVEATSVYGGFVAWKSAGYKVE
ncbi:rhodanese-like domain-containing protein [Arcanobacterium canis]|uniref:Rhodanese-like domain-containing protein n=1 Tax=Arcanobacterium canis TaxID=999183 RepID=A0ABY8G0D1_9ACTO|nr:rhodanese-like domain-containing protein [Arcanobacterium canis]WFM84027.1 rhodanese-like domain-containing protein [Arcanobacterium canis]